MWGGGLFSWDKVEEEPLAQKVKLLAGDQRMRQLIIHLVLDFTENHV